MRFATRCIASSSSSAGSLRAAMVSRPYLETSAAPIGSRGPRLQRLEVLDQVRLFRGSEPEAEGIVIALHHVLQRRGTAVVEVRGMLPERAQRRRAVQLGGAPLRVSRVGGN